MLKAIHAQESRRAAQDKVEAVIADLRSKRLTRAAELIEESIDETLTYYGFPDSHWRKIRTNNPLERIMKETRRRTRVVGVRLIRSNQWRSWLHSPTGNHASIWQRPG